MDGRRLSTYVTMHLTIVTVSLNGIVWFLKSSTVTWAICISETDGCPDRLGEARQIRRGESYYQCTVGVHQGNKGRGHMHAFVGGFVVGLVGVTTRTTCCASDAHRLGHLQRQDNGRFPLRRLYEVLGLTSIRVVGALNWRS